MDGLLYYLSLNILKFPGYLIQNPVYCNGVSIKLYSYVMSHFKVQTHSFYTLNLFLFYLYLKIQLKEQRLSRKPVHMGSENSHIQGVVQRDTKHRFRIIEMRGLAANQLDNPSSNPLNLSMVFCWSSDLDVMVWLTSLLRGSNYSCIPFSSLHYLLLRDVEILLCLVE